MKARSNGLQKMTRASISDVRVSGATSHSCTEVTTHASNGPYLISRVHKNKSMQRLISSNSLWGSGTAKFQVT